MTQRIKEIDIAKGIGMILVIVGHINASEYLTRLIFCFHMPLFFFLSGVVHKRGNIKKYFQQLIVPMLIWGFIDLVIYSLCYSLPLNEFLIQLRNLLLGGAANSCKFEPAAALWFLPCVFILKIIDDIPLNAKRGGGYKNCSMCNKRLAFVLV